MNKQCVLRRVASLGSSNAGRSAFRSLINYMKTQYFMKSSTGKILRLIFELLRIRLLIIIRLPIRLLRISL